MRKANSMSMQNSSLEKLKHRLVVDLESKKWGFRIQELHYIEAGNHLRSLNQLMWQVPGMAIAITGGLWYGTTAVDADLARTWVLSFTALVDLLTVGIIWRLRHLIAIHLAFQHSFEARVRSKERGGWIVVICWGLILSVAAVLSVLGAVYPSYLTKTSNADKSVPSCNISIDNKLPDLSMLINQCPCPKHHRTAPLKSEPCNP